MTIKIQNPILPGFNADPAICRVGDDYYIATSTFEWYPGVQISHSKDLKNWQVISRPLNRPEQLNMIGNPDSGGIWAPCLTHSDGQFWLIYTDVKRQNGTFKDTHNYLVTCDTIDGDWSDPIYLNSSGFDPSLFHDDDGKKWLVNMIWDYRPNNHSFGGILLQEYDHEQQKLVGPIDNIFKGSSQGLVEGPHVYKRNGYYYLFTAEGGTSYEHVETIARSRHLKGPYEMMPDVHLVTAKDHPENYLQRNGHGSFCDTPNGDFVFVHLCSRPLRNSGRSPMGRETSLQNMTWKNDWPMLSHGSVAPLTEVTLPIEKEFPFEPLPDRIEFNSQKLDLRLQWLRNPYPEEFIDLETRPGYLRLKGFESLGSVFRSSLVALRQTSFKYQATTEIDFNPADFLQLGGLVCYYNTHKYHYLYVSYDEETSRRRLGIMSCVAGATWDSEFPLYEELKNVEIPQTGNLFLRANIDHHVLYFSWSADGESWNKIDARLDASVLSDEAGTGEGSNFTGAFAGVCCQDLSGQQRAADFKYFEYSNDK
jgi:xylan 1,4-beta-xylosidase